MNRLSILCIAFLFFATKAKCDKIIFKGDTLVTTEKSFLESYPGIKSLKPKMLSYQSACYNAEFTILNDELYLTNIYGCDGDVNKKEDINSLFNVSGGKVKADWVKGIIWMPVGKPIRVHGFSTHGRTVTPFYKAETRITIKNGSVTLQEFNYSNSQKSIYQPYSDEIELPNTLRQKFIYQHVDWSKIPDLKDKTIKVSFSFQSGTSGKPENMKKIPGQYTLSDAPNAPFHRYEEDDPNDPSNNPLYLNEARRVINLIPWSVYYRHGEVFKEGTAVSIYFSEETRKIGIEQ